MTLRETNLAKAWNDTGDVRSSRAWWIAAVVCGAALAVAAYYIAPGDSKYLAAFVGVIVGFFAPYAAAVVVKLPGAAVRERERAWKKVGPVVRRTR